MGSEVSHRGSPTMNVDLARVQFAFTTINHFFFVPVTIGLAFLTALLQTAWYRSRQEEYLRLTRFFGTLLMINVAIGVGVHRDHGHHRILHRVDLHRPVPIRDGLHHPRPNNLTVDNTASGPYALKVMTVVVVVLLPVVLLYQAWTYTSSAAASAGPNSSPRRSRAHRLAPARQ